MDLLQRLRDPSAPATPASRNDDAVRELLAATGRKPIPTTTTVTTTTAAQTTAARQQTTAAAPSGSYDPLPHDLEPWSEKPLFIRQPARSGFKNFISDGESEAEEKFLEAASIAAEACKVCLSPQFWLNAYGGLFCCKCQKPPVSSMVRQVVVVAHMPEGPRWQVIEGSAWLARLVRESKQKINRGGGRTSKSFT